MILGAVALEIGRGGVSTLPALLVRPSRGEVRGRSNGEGDIPLPMGEPGCCAGRYRELFDKPRGSGGTGILGGGGSPFSSFLGNRGESSRCPTSLDTGEGGSPLLSTPLEYGAPRPAAGTPFWRGEVWPLDTVTVRGEIGRGDNAAAGGGTGGKAWPTGGRGAIPRSTVVILCLSCMSFLCSFPLFCSNCITLNTLTRVSASSAISWAERPAWPSITFHSCGMPSNMPVSGLKPMCISRLKLVGVPMTRPTRGCPPFFFSSFSRFLLSLASAFSLRLFCFSHSLRLSLSSSLFRFSSFSLAFCCSFS